MTRTCPCGAALHNGRLKLCPPCRAEATRRYHRAYYEAHEQGGRRVRQGVTFIEPLRAACPIAVAVATLDRDYPWLRGAL